MPASYGQRAFVMIMTRVDRMPTCWTRLQGIIVEDVHLEKGEPESEEIVIWFRVAGRSHCLYGFRTIEREPVEPELQL